MDFYAIVDAVIDLVRTRSRVSFPALQEQFGLDGDRLDAVKAELRYAQPDTVGIDSAGLTWTGAAEPAAERRQLTVLFCDLVDSTPLFGAVDPEDLREVMRAYFRTCDKVVARFGGYTAQYLGDGLLVFFGYPQAHEDDAARQPVLLVVEDLHWADATTVELLTRLIGKLCGTRIFMLLTSRPEFVCPWPDDSVRQLTPARLIPAEATHPG